MEQKEGGGGLGVEQGTRAHSLGIHFYPSLYRNSLPLHPLSLSPSCLPLSQANWEMVIFSKVIWTVCLISEFLHWDGKHNRGTLPQALAVYTPQPASKSQSSKVTLSNKVLHPLLLNYDALNMALISSIKEERL